VSVRRFAVMIVLAGCGLGVLALFAAISAPRVTAQIRPYTPPRSISGGDWTQRIEDILPPGVESRAEAAARVAAYNPDPVKNPVPRSAWNGKPDFSGVYWPDATIAEPPVALESLYRPEARPYREAGGAAQGLIDWRGIDTPGYHCWPSSPVNGSMGGTVQLVSAPGFLLVINEGLGYFRIIPIVGESGRPPGAQRKPSFMGSSVGHWEGDTLVVEVTNFNGKPWLGPARAPNQPPQTSSDALRVVERWSRPDAQVFEYRVVVEDPKMLTAPWTGPSERRGIMSYDTVQESLCFLDPELDARHREFAAAAAKKAGTR
jgi:hypothetical protein